MKHTSPDPWGALGVPREMVTAGLDVMVAYTVSAAVNGDPALICYATVIGPAQPSEAAALGDPGDVWWLDVHTAPGVSLPQMFHVGQILGIPAIGIADSYTP